MKKSMLFAAVAAVALSSCSKNEFEGPEATAGAGGVEIKIGQSVGGLETKAAINRGDRVEATIIASNAAAPADWMTFVPVTANTFTSASDPWSATTYANVSVGSFEAGSDMPIGLNPSLYANPASASAGGATLTGIAPKGTVEGGKVVFSVQDGQQDVMIAETTDHQQVSGTGVKTIDPFTLTFNHKTAQLRFRFAAVNTAGTAAWTGAVIKVKSVTVKKAFVPTAVRLMPKGTSHEVVWTNVSKNLLFENFTEDQLPDTYGTAVVGKPDFLMLDKQALIKPGVPVELDVMLTIDGKEKAYTAIKPMKDAAALTTTEGKFHNISLTVKQPITPTGSPEIVATATVTEWAEGDEGSAEL